MRPQWWAQRARPGPPGKMSPGLARAFDAFAPAIRLAHRPVLEGLEHLPASGPFVLVANHSGGMGFSEAIAFAHLWRTRVGAERKIAALGHPFGFFLWPLSFVIRRLGIVPSTYEHARDALSKGIPLLVFPGGDFEVSRPFWQASKVQFAGRKGFLRLAREARVPVVPMGIRGSYWTSPNVWRSKWILPWLVVLPRLMGVKHYPMTLLGLVGALVAATLPLHPALRALLGLAWVGSLFQFLPWWPASIRFRLGKPSPSDELFPGDLAEGLQLELAYQRVESAVQELVDR